jgi:hypothetical protein
MSKKEKKMIQSGTRAIAVFPPIDVKMLIRTWDRDITLSDYLCCRCRIINIDQRRERERERETCTRLVRVSLEIEDIHARRALMMMRTERIN